MNKREIFDVVKKYTRLKQKVEDLENWVRSQYIFENYDGYDEYVELDKSILALDIHAKILDILRGEDNK